MDQARAENQEASDNLDHRADGELRDREELEDSPEVWDPPDPPDSVDHEVARAPAESWAPLETQGSQDVPDPGENQVGVILS